MLELLQQKGFAIHFVCHAAAILEKDFPEALEDIEQALAEIEVPITEIVGSGGGETKGTQRMRRAFANHNWEKTNFEITKIINGEQKESRSHEIDHVKKFSNGVLALEIEWNNKDPFFDRDLENFKRLHAEGAISVGMIVTRDASLHQNMYDFVLRFARENHVGSFEDLERLQILPTVRQRKGIQKRVSRTKNPIEFPCAWADQFIADKYGEATTHWRKLMDRVHRGVGNPCPLLLIGLPATIVSFPEQSSEQTAAAVEAAAMDNADGSE